MDTVRMTVVKKQMQLQMMQAVNDLLDDQRKEIEQAVKEAIENFDIKRKVREVAAGVVRAAVHDLVKHSFDWDW